MTRIYKPIELDYLPTRASGQDELHTHTTFKPSAVERESCAACAQLANDFAWLRFRDAVAGRETEFGTVEEAVLYAEENVESKLDRLDLRGFRDRELVA
jgi:hypothetical protein